MNSYFRYNNLLILNIKKIELIKINISSLNFKLNINFFIFNIRTVIIKKLKTILKTVLHLYPIKTNYLVISSQFFIII